MSSFIQSGYNKTVGGKKEGGSKEGKQRWCSRKMARGPVGFQTQPLTSHVALGET